MFTKTLRQHYWILAPVVGIIIFAILYLIAAHFYPGGSQIDKGSKGFNWAQNYWCDLLSPLAINGGLNTGRPIALAAMGVLCVSLGMFWHGFPQLAGLRKTKRLTTQVAGILSMVTCVISLFVFRRSASWGKPYQNIPSDRQSTPMAAKAIGLPVFNPPFMARGLNRSHQ